MFNKNHYLPNEQLRTARNKKWNIWLACFSIINISYHFQHNGRNLQFSAVWSSCMISDMKEDNRIKPVDPTPTAVAIAAEAPSISKDISSDALSVIESFREKFRHSLTIPPSLNTKDSYSEFLRSFLQVRSIQRGKISCLLTVKPPIENLYNGMHGGAVAAVTELLALACARTVVGKDKKLFLGELSASYLSVAPENANVLVDGSVVKSGRNVTAVAIEFKHEESGQLFYRTRATFYNMPAASL